MTQENVGKANTMYGDAGVYASLSSLLMRTFRWVSVVLRGVLAGCTSIANILESRHLPQPGEIALPVDADSVPSPKVSYSTVYITLSPGYIVIRTKYC